MYYLGQGRDWISSTLRTFGHILEYVEYFIFFQILLLFNWIRKQNFLPLIFTGVMLIFSRHPSLSIISYANTVWSSFFKHQVISRDPVFKKYIPQWFETAAPKIIKVPMH